VRALNKTFGYLRALRNLLRSLEPSIIHSNGFKMHILAIWAKPSGVPLVWHIHDYVASRPVMRILMRIHSRGCSAVIANSDSVARDLRGVCGQKLRTHKLWNAVDLAEFSPEGSQLDLDQLSGLSAPEQPVLRVGLVGTFARWKGHDIFLRSLAMLPAEIPVRGYIVGGPLYQTDGSQWRLEDLRQMANKLGLAGRIGFTGFVSRPAEAMRALDIVVHASTEPEPFGLVIVEAMACGRPVITTRWGGASEITGGDSGALAHIPGDPSSLADRIVQLAGNPSLRQRLSLAGRGNAEKRFDRASLGPACADIYESVARTALFSLSSQLAR
jgi:glycosyltransferase involved in cell wall biosynthesis